jgi:hypothetical protein
VIRYVLAVALVVAILGLGATAVDHGATVRSETALDATVERVDDAAVDLYENEALALAGRPPPQRVLDVTLPDGGYTSAAPEHVTLARAPEESLTQVTYRFSGRAEQRHVIEAPLVRAGEERFRLDGYTGEVTLRLRLVEADGRPAVSVTVEQ